MKNELHSLFERHFLAPCGAAIIKVMVFLILKSDVEFLEHAAFLAEDETLKLVWLEPPVENEPSRLGVAGSSQANE